MYYTFCLEASRDVKVQDCPPLIGGDATGALIVGSTFWVLLDERLEKIEGHSSSLSCVCVYVCETGFKPRVLQMLLTPALKIVVCLFIIGSLVSQGSFIYSDSPDLKMGTDIAGLSILVLAAFGTCW